MMVQAVLCVFLQRRQRQGVSRRIFSRAKGFVQRQEEAAAVVPCPSVKSGWTASLGAYSTRARLVRGSRTWWARTLRTTTGT